MAAAEGEGLRFLVRTALWCRVFRVLRSLLLGGIILGDLWVLQKLASFQCFRHFAFFFYNKPYSDTINGGFFLWPGRGVRVGLQQNQCED